MTESGEDAGEPTVVRERTRGVYVVVYEPPGASARAPSIVVCPSLGEEQAFARPAMHRVAARLARAGHLALVYDPRGHGDADGEFRDVTLETLVDDLETAATHPLLRGGADACLAVRFGALVVGAGLARLGARHLVLAAPVLNGATYLAALLRKNVAAQLAAKGRVESGVADLEATLARGGCVDVDGHALSPSLAETMRGARPVEAFAGSDRRIDVVEFASAAAAEVYPFAPGRRLAVDEVEIWREHRRLLASDAPTLSKTLLDLLRAHLDA